MLNQESTTCSRSMHSPKALNNACCHVDHNEESSHTVGDSNQTYESNRNNSKSNQSCELILNIPSHIHDPSSYIGGRYSVFLPGKFQSFPIIVDSFKSQGTEELNSLYEALVIDLSGECDEDRPQQLQEGHRPSVSTGKMSFKRGSLHDDLLLDDQITSFQTSSQDLSKDIDQYLHGSDNTFDDNDTFRTQDSCSLKDTDDEYHQAKAAKSVEQGTW